MFWLLIGNVVLMAALLFVAAGVFLLSFVGTYLLRGWIFLGTGLVLAGLGWNILLHADPREH